MARSTPKPKLPRRSSRTSSPQPPESTEPSVNDIARANRLVFEPKTPRQRFHMKSLKDNQLTVVVGPAGTGKTYVSIHRAVEGLLRGAFDKIVLMRPAVALEGERHGFLPGDKWAKVAPWARPMLRKMAKLLGGEDKVLALHKKGQLAVEPFTFLRGDEFEAKTFVMVDEAQNCTPGQLKAFTTRIADGAVIVIAGDVEQNDLEGADSASGLGVLQELLDAHPVGGIGVVEYLVADIARGTMCKAFVEAWRAWEAGDAA